MVSILIFISLLSALSACCNVWQAVSFHRRELEWREIENQWRKRERELVDRLLQQGDVNPLEIQREQVVKIQDPEVPTETWVDQAFREDELKEELEQLYPEVAHMSHTEARARYRADWERLEKRWKEDHTPLRVQ